MLTAWNFRKRKLEDAACFLKQLCFSIEMEWDDRLESDPAANDQSVSGVPFPISLQHWHQDLVLEDPVDWICASYQQLCFMNILPILWFYDILVQYESESGIFQQDHVDSFQFNSSNPIPLLNHLNLPNAHHPRYGYVSPLEHKAWRKSQ